MATKPTVQAVTLGPWSSMNNRSEIGTIQDNQLAIVSNMEFDADSALVTRPAITQEEPVAPLTTDMQPLGYYVRSDGEIFLVVATATDTRLYDMVLKTWTTIWASPASDFCQYDNKVVMSSRTGPGGYWEAGAFTAMPTMPALEKVVIYKSRFWGFGPAGTATASTIFFSNLTVIAPPSTIFNWTTSTDFFPVGLGDGAHITDLISDPVTLLIFKNGSTWVFDYPTSPTTGTLREVSTTIGATNRWSVGTYQNYYIVFFAGTLYQFIQQRYYPLNSKLITFAPSVLSGGATADVRVSIFGDRVLLWYFGSLYCYGLITSGFSTWSSATSACQFWMAPAELTTNGNRVAIAVTGEGTAGKKILLRIEDGVRTTGAGETFTAMIRTKAYDFKQPGVYKRLFWWLAQLKTARAIDAFANPIALPGSGVTWDQMATTTWDVLALGTWTNPLIIPTVYEDNVSNSSAAPYRVVVKMRAAFHFLSAYFDVSFQVDGTGGTAPGKIYSIQAFVSAQSEVSQKVS